MTHGVRRFFAIPFVITPAGGALTAVFAVSFVLESAWRIVEAPVTTPRGRLVIRRLPRSVAPLRAGRSNDAVRLWSKSRQPIQSR
jgi:hypothetical protein